MINNYTAYFLFLFFLKGNCYIDKYSYKMQ